MRGMQPPGREPPVLHQGNPLLQRNTPIFIASNTHYLTTHTTQVRSMMRQQFPPSASSPPPLHLSCPCNSRPGKEMPSDLMTSMECGTRSTSTRHITLLMPCPAPVRRGGIVALNPTPPRMKKNSSLGLHGFLLNHHRSNAAASAQDCCPPMRYPLPAALRMPPAATIPIGPIRHNATTPRHAFLRCQLQLLRPPERDECRPFHDTSMTEYSTDPKGPGITQMPPLLSSIRGGSS